MDAIAVSSPRRLSALFFVLILGLTAPVATLAQAGQPTLADQQELRDRAEREARERAERQAIPEVLGPAAPAAANYHSTDLPDESPCFRIDAIVLDGAHRDRFAFAQRYLDKYQGRCIGQEGIAQMVRRASDLILAKGYVTTRIGLPEQNLGAGILRLQLVAGTIRQIRFADGPPRDAMWKSAFPARAGDVLNLRALEQGLEQLKRVPSQDVEMELVPGAQPGESDVVITLKAARRWRSALSLDDGGSEGTGKQQAGTTVWADNLLGINDLLSMGINSDGSAEHGKGTHGYNASWSAPLGNWRFSTSTYGSRYAQIIRGNNDDFSSTGRSRSLDLTVERLLTRGQSYRTAMELRLAQRHSRSFVEGVELRGQRRRTTSAELALLHRQYVGSLQADLRLAHRRGLPWLGGDDDGPGRDDEAPTFRYRITTLDIGVGAPVLQGPRPIYWNSALRYQWTSDPLYGAEFISIGGRYTVNGFDGEVMMGGATGGYWRNSLNFSLHRRFSPYVGVDVGHIASNAVQGIAGGDMVGAHVGVRGQALSLDWDVFVGFPLEAPRAIRAQSDARVVGFRLATQF
ncbi:ShlB/FhaC/HecB family hemolysin secretion/activation protein [Stenotrophomonas sp. Ker107b]